jgi:hypothetical protein
MKKENTLGGRTGFLTGDKPSKSEILAPIFDEIKEKPSLEESIKKVLETYVQMCETGEKPLSVMYSVDQDPNIILSNILFLQPDILHIYDFQSQENQIYLANILSCMSNSKNHDFFSNLKNNYRETFDATITQNKARFSGMKEGCSELINDYLWFTNGKLNADEKYSLLKDVLVDLGQSESISNCVRDSYEDIQSAIIKSIKSEKPERVIFQFPGGVSTPNRYLGALYTPKLELGEVLQGKERMIL